MCSRGTDTICVRIADTSITVSPLSYTFDGNAKTPSVTVKDGTKTLVRDTDYSLKYENNINPGTARVIISGINSYGGSVTKNFSINENPKKDISEMDIAINPFYYYYDGKAKTPAVTVKKGTTSLKKDTHYTVTYSNNTNVGQGIVKITGKGDYSGSCEKSFNIYPRYISEATVALENDSLEYNGKERKPKTIVTIGSQTLVRNTDYSVTYSDNINIGMATATITGKNNYQGSVKLSFSIVNPKTEFVWKRDNWNFNNSGEYFFYGTKTYGQLMNNKYRQKLMDSLSYVEYEDVFRGSSQAKAWIDELWQGSCYGMSATAFLSQSGFMQYSQYHQGASRLNDLLASDEDVLSVINYYQMLQIKDSCQQQFAHTPKNSQKQNIEQIISLLGTNSVVMVGIKQEKTNFAHELLAYGYEYGSWTKNGVTYTGRILICDPNYSSNKDSNNNDSYIYFKHDTYQWTIPIYKNYQVSSGYGAVFNHISANINEINEGGYMSAYIASNHNPNFVARLNAYAISDNRSVVKVKETSGGNYMNLAPAPGEIEEAYSYVMYGNDKKGTLGYNLYDSEAAYKVEQDDPVNMQLSLKYENCRLSAGSAAGKKALFDPKGFVEVYGDSAEYDLSMVFNEDYPTDWFAIEVSGENSNEASLLKGRTGYVVSGDNLKNVKVYVNNKQDSASISFSTDYKAVYIYEIDKNTIGLKVDKDSNGTYETSIKGVPILENNSYISSSKIKIGSSVNVTASAKGGSGNLQYAVLYKKKSDTKWTVKQNFSTNTTVSVKPANATDYDICVKVRDSDGNVEKKFFVLNVYDVLANKSSISDTYISLGSTVTVHASATGGTGSYTYAVLYKKKADTTWTIKQNFSKNANISIKPAKATDYNICIKVKDDNGDIEKKYFVVKVYDVLSNTSTVASLFSGAT